MQTPKHKQKSKQMQLQNRAANKKHAARNKNKCIKVKCAANKEMIVSVLAAVLPQMKRLAPVGHHIIHSGLKK